MLLTFKDVFDNLLQPSMQSVKSQEQSITGILNKKLSCRKENVQLLHGTVLSKYN